MSFWQFVLQDTLILAVAGFVTLEFIVSLFILPRKWFLKRPKTSVWIRLFKDGILLGILLLLIVQYFWTADWVEAFKIISFPFMVFLVIQNIVRFEDSCFKIRKDSYHEEE